MHFVPASCPACFSRRLTKTDSGDYACQTCSYEFLAPPGGRQDLAGWWAAAKTVARLWREQQDAERALAEPLMPPTENRADGPETDAVDPRITRPFCPACLLRIPARTDGGTNVCPVCDFEFPTPAGRDRKELDDCWDKARAAGRRWLTDHPIPYRFAPAECPACSARSLQKTDGGDYACQTCTYEFSAPVCRNPNEVDDWRKSAKAAAQQWQQKQSELERAALDARLNGFRDSLVGQLLPSRIMWKAAIQHLFTDLPIEVSLVAFLDEMNRVLGLDFAVGTETRVPHPPAGMILCATSLGATKIVMAHNHPQGGPTPSDMDAEWAATVHMLAKEQGIELVDCIVLCSLHSASLRSVLDTRRFKDYIREY